MMLLSGFDIGSINTILEHLPRLIAEICAIYYAVKFGTKHGNGN